MWLIAIAVVLLVCVGPVMVGARMVGAGRNGFWACLVALIIAGIISAVAVRMFHGLGLLSIFASALGYMLVLDTTYLRGLGIAVIQGILVVVLVFILALTAVGSMFHLKDMMHDSPSSSSTV